MDHTYRAFGLAIGSELPLPGLPKTDRRPQVRIRRGTVGDWQGEATVRYGERCRIRGQHWFIRFKLLPFTALISDGNLIQFEADAGRDDMAALHILGSCTGAMLYQRGYVPLHGNTLVNSDGAAMLVGRIGAGKSATSMALLKRGHHLLADDISAVSFDAAQKGEAPQVLPGLPRIKLWKASLDHFGHSTQELERLRPGMEKFHVPVGDLFCGEPKKLRAIYVLQPGDRPGVRVRQLSGLARLDAIRGHLYKIRFPDAIRNFPPLLGRLCQLADTVSINLVERPREGNTIDEVAEAIDKDLAATGISSAVA
jgi:hypothetical protein